MSVCPTCGQALAADNDLGNVKLIGHFKQLYDIVRSANSTGISAEGLFARIYNGRSDGGPISGNQMVYTLINGLNYRLRPAHLEVRSGGDRQYRLVRKLRRPRRGEQVLSVRNIEELKRLYAAGKLTQKQLAARYGVSQPHISVIVHHGSQPAYRKLLAAKKAAK